MSNEKCDHCGDRWGMGDGQWIDCNDRLPDPNEPVLACRLGLKGYLLIYLDKERSEYFTH